VGSYQLGSTQRDRVGDLPRSAAAAGGRIAAEAAIRPLGPQTAGVGHMRPRKRHHLAYAREHECGSRVADGAKSRKSPISGPGALRTIVRRALGICDELPTGIRRSEPPSRPSAGRWASANDPSIAVPIGEVALAHASFSALGFALASARLEQQLRARAGLVLGRCPLVVGSPRRGSRRTSECWLPASAVTVEAKGLLSSSHHMF
jgi:hypothetical protein